MTTYRAERDMIEVSIDPALPGSPGWRQFYPGPWHYYRDDEEITEDEYYEAMRHRPDAAFVEDTD